MAPRSGRRRCRVSRIDMPRPRYVAFQVDVAQEGREVPRRAVQEALRAALRSGGTVVEAQLTRYAFPHGIARATHDRQAALTQALGRLRGPEAGGWSARTLGASGTLRALTDRLGVLHERDAQKGATPAPAGAATGPRHHSA